LHLDAETSLTPSGNEFCILCGSPEHSKHSHIDCDHKQKSQIKEIYGRLRLIIETGVDEAGVTENRKTAKEDDVKMEDPETAQKEEDKGDQSYTTKKTDLFLDPITLSDVGHRDEGGAYMVNCMGANDDGPTHHRWPQ
jgi:hypothetical protein